MEMNFRWYGESDKLPLEYIRQIPGMKGIISAIYDVPVGEVWPIEKIMSLKNTIEAAGLEFTSIESVPVHEDIKLGLPTRDQLIENYKETLNNLGKAGIKVVIYNFMPVFDWTRSELEHVLPDGSTALIYDNETVLKMDPVKGDLSLPGWDSSYTKEGLKKLMDQYSKISEENLWENLEYFLKAIIPVAEINDIKMAIHPDDPPWSIFGLPRIITSKENLEKLVNIVDSPSNGLCICTGSLGASPANNLPEIIRYFGAKNKIHYAHIRNVKHTGEHSFEEAAHLTEYGSLDMYEIVKAFDDVAFNGPFRPDHGRMIWGETGKPGYGLYDRALGAVYINGLLEAIRKDKK